MTWVVLVFSNDDDLLYAVSAKDSWDAIRIHDQIETRHQDLRAEYMPLEDNLVNVEEYVS